jgi:hypothetical protein
MVGINVKKLANVSASELEQYLKTAIYLYRSGS